MNEKIYRVIIIILILISIIGFIFIRYYQQQLRSIRNQLESARNRESDITDTIEGYASRTERIFSESFDSIGTIREAVTELEKEFYSLIDRIHDLTGSECLIDCEY